MFNEERCGVEIFERYQPYDLVGFLKAANFLGYAEFWVDNDNVVKKLTYKTSSKHDQNLDMIAAGFRSVLFQIRDIGWGELLISRIDNINKDAPKHYLVPKNGRWKGWEPNNRRFPHGITVV